MDCGNAVPAAEIINGKLFLWTREERCRSGAEVVSHRRALLLRRCLNIPAYSMIVTRSCRARADLLAALFRHHRACDLKSLDV